MLELTTRNLARLKELYETRAISQKDLEQAVSDQQTAEGALRAARDAVRMFGKTDAEIDRIIADAPWPTRFSWCRVPSRAGSPPAMPRPGLLVQPGNAPAPYTVADISTMWMLANVAESDSPAFQCRPGGQGQSHGLSGPDFRRTRSPPSHRRSIPNTRRVLVRSEIEDPQHELRSGMFANFVIRIGEPVRSPAIPLDGVVREGDGTMTAWVTADRRRLTSGRSRSASNGTATTRSSKARKPANWSPPKARYS